VCARWMTCIPLGLGANVEILKAFSVDQFEGFAR
jgi:hypothetical protein